MLAWSKRKLTARLCHGRIKAWEKLFFNSFSQAFFVFYGKSKKMGGINGMNINWIKVVVAAMFEVFWVIGLKHADDFWTWTGTVIAIIISFYLMIMSAENSL